MALLLFWLQALGGAPLFDVDEGAFAQASREMLASGDWGHTTLNGQPRFDKPILIYWLQATGLHFLGRDAFAVRLPSALAAWLWCLATWAFVAPRRGRLAASLATLILATSLGPLAIGRAATADALLNLLLALSLFDLWRWIEETSVTHHSSQALRSPRGIGSAPLRRALLWMSLGLLAKGPVAVVVPVGTLCLWALWCAWTRARTSRDSNAESTGDAIGRDGGVGINAAGGMAPPAFAHDLPRRLLRDLRRDPIAWSIPLVVALPWYAYALHRHGGAFVEGFLLRHNLQRFTGILEGHGGSPVYHLLMLPVLMLPWTPLLPALLASLGTLGRDPMNRWLLAWSAFVLLFFSVAGTKLPHYGLYGYTPVAILAGCLLARPIGHRVRVGAIALMAAGLAAVSAHSERLAVWLARSRGDPYWLAMMDPTTLPPGPAPLWCLAVIVAALCVSLAAASTRLHEDAHPHRVGASLAGIGLASASLLIQQTIPWWGQAIHGPVQPLTAIAVARGLPLVQWGVDQPSAGFLRGASAPRRAPGPGEAVLVRIDRIDSLPQVPGQARPRRIACERGLCLLQMPAPQPHSP